MLNDGTGLMLLQTHFKVNFKLTSNTLQVTLKYSMHSYFYVFMKKKPKGIIKLLYFLQNIGI